MSVLKVVEQDFLSCFWVLDNPFRFLPIYNSQLPNRVHIFPRDIVTDQPHPFVINLWPEGDPNGLR